MKEAASLKKYDLFADSRDLLSQSSQSGLSSPSVSAPNSPAVSLASPVKTSTELQPPSPLSDEALLSTPEKEEQQEKVNGELRNKTDEAPRGAAEQHEAAQNVSPGGGAPEAAKPEAVGPVQTQSQTQEVAAPQTVVQEEVLSVNARRAELAAEPQVQNADAADDAERLPEVGHVTTAQDAAGPAGGAASRTETEAPPSVQTPADLKHEEAAGPAPVSDANPLDVSAGEPPTSDIRSTEGVQATQSSEEEGSTDLGKSPVSSDEPAEDRTTSHEPAARAEAASDDGEADLSAQPSAKAAKAPTNQETPSDPDALPPDSIKEIRNLVVEVIEVEELVRCFPDGVPKEE